MALLDIIKEIGQQLGAIPQLFSTQAKAKQAEKQREKIEALTKKSVTQQQQPVNKTTTIAVAPHRSTGSSLLLDAILRVANIPNKLAGGIVETAALNLKKPEETFSEYYERLPGLTDIAGKSIIETSQKVLGEKYGKAVGQAGAFIAALTLDPFNLTPFGATDDVLRILAKEQELGKVSMKLKELVVADRSEEH